MPAAPAAGSLLSVATSPAWLDVALADLPALLIDHASCEQKAAAAAMALLARVPDDEIFVTTLSHLAVEEVRHFELVYRLIRRRGGTLDGLRPNPYVKALRALGRGGREGLVDRLLVAALIEARSHERFGLLAAAVPEPDVQALYEALIPPEAGHAALFVGLAERVAPHHAVQVRLAELAGAEGAIIAAQSRAPAPRMHG